MVDHVFEARVRAELGSDRVIILDPATFNDFSAIKRGVIVVYSEWSSGPEGALAAWSKVLAMIDQQGLSYRTSPTVPVRTEKWLHVINELRATPDWFLHVFEKTPRALGETFWIKKSKIVHFDKWYGRRWESLVEPTRRLLE